MSKNRETAEQIATLCDRYGWNWDVRGDILTLTKEFNPGDRDAFCQADQEYYSILCHLPCSRPGSVWGTSADGVGALTALNTGVFKINKSGGNKRVLTALAKMS